mmetsp:Transcript_63802/g.120846  ORF Transcript_63802/g.120846 Transcript_63802/m.120846 type:complete len:663 (+) Transcript_63802:80-2068(+)
MVGMESQGGYPSAMAPVVLRVPATTSGETLSHDPENPFSDPIAAAALAEDFHNSISQLPVPGGMTDTVWEALCKRMLTDIHRNHTMTADEKEAALRHLVLPIPGEPAGRCLRVVEDPNGVFTVGATGAVLWPAAVALMQHLDATVPTMATNSGKRILELGAGLGCVGSFLTQHKGCRVTLTDVPEAMPLLVRNVTENFSTGDAPEVLPFRWGDTNQLAVLTICGAFDLVVGSDVTYRPEYLDELLRCAHALLRPGGRLVISAQDRPGEVALFREAVSRTNLFNILLDEEGPLPATGIEEGSTLEAGQTRWGDVQAPDIVGQVLLFELEAKESKVASTTDSACQMLNSLDEVEAEFERITGIRPDPELCAAMRSASASKPALPDPKVPLWAARTEQTKPGNSQVEEQQLAKRADGGGSIFRPGGLKDRLIKDYLDRGLGDLLCEQDEDLAAIINAKRPEERPRTDGEKRRTAEAYYAAKAGCTAAVPALEGGRATLPESSDAAAEAAALEAIKARDVAAGGETTTCAAVEAAEVKPSSASAATSSARDSKIRPDGARVRSCLSGLEWHMDINKADKQLSVVVTFGDTVWEVLQGSLVSGESGGSKTFRDAVDFELSDAVLRVTHHGAVALELELPLQVDAVTAAAKLNSRHKRVTVRAALLCD